MDNDRSAPLTYHQIMVARIGPKNPNKMRVFLKEWRAHFNLTQEQVADRIGTTKGTVQRMEVSTREPNLGYLAAFSEAVDRDVSDLFRDPNAPTQAELLRGLEPNQLREVSDFATFVRLRDGTRG